MGILFEFQVKEDLDSWRTIRILVDPLVTKEIEIDCNEANKYYISRLFE